MIDPIINNVLKQLKAERDRLSIAIEELEALISLQKGPKEKAGKGASKKDRAEDSPS